MPSEGRPYGRYILEDRIAMGGMAEIFRARTATEGFEKRVCIKRILPHFLEDDMFVTMFRDEARMAAKLHHANCVHVFDFGEVHGTLYLAMEFVDGSDLRRIMDTARKKQMLLSVGEAVQIAIDVARGLHHAHTLVENGRALSVVHRDVSPHNVLLSKAGEVKVTDFGIARAAERSTHTSTGVVKGKTAYMSPEQAQGFDFDHRLDQFAAGIVLWEMLTGMRLFAAENDAATLRKVLACQVPPPSSIRAEVPKALDALVLRALAPDPDDRFADMREYEGALSRVLYSGAIDATQADVRALFARIAMDEVSARRKTQVLSRVAPLVRTPNSEAPDLSKPSDDASHVSDDGNRVTRSDDVVSLPSFSPSDEQAAPPSGVRATTLLDSGSLGQPTTHPALKVDGTPSTETLNSWSDTPLLSSGGVSSVFTSASDRRSSADAPTALALGHSTVRLEVTPTHTFPGADAQADVASSPDGKTNRHSKSTLVGLESFHPHRDGTAQEPSTSAGHQRAMGRTGARVGLAAMVLTGALGVAVALWPVRPQESASPPAAGRDTVSVAPHTATDDGGEPTLVHRGADRAGAAPSHQDGSTGRRTSDVSTLAPHDARLTSKDAQVLNVAASGDVAVSGSSAAAPSDANPSGGQRIPVVLELKSGWGYLLVGNRRTIELSTEPSSVLLPLGKSRVRVELSDGRVISTVVDVPVDGQRRFTIAVD